MLSNITNYKNVNDWFYLVPAAIVVDFIVITLTKYSGKAPYFKVDALDAWYTQFGTLAMASDVLSALIGIMISRYIYTGLGLKNPLLFLGIVIAFQLVHDAFFYLAVIRPLPVGHNKMIDVFKAYSEENGAKILVADALILLSTVGIASLLKSLPDHITIATSLIAMYSLTYIVYTRKQSRD